jgi:hypothetical protein
MSEPSQQTRDRLAEIADALIPEAHGLPAATSVGVATYQLDTVLRSRPDIAPALERGLSHEFDDPLELLADLEESDREAQDAILLAVVAGYYMHPRIQELIGYPGQVPQDAQRLSEREMFEEGLAEMLAEAHARGPIYRPTPGLEQTS